MTIGNWELGKERPGIRHTAAIIALLGHDPESAGDGLPARLRAIRRRLGLTQEQMAKRLDLDEGSLSRWESGSRQPSRWMAGRVKSLLDAIEAGDGDASTSSSLSFYDQTRWRRRPPSDLLAIEPVTLGEQIRHARIGRGMSQAALARLFGVTHATLYRWESGAAPVPSRRMAAIQLFLKMKPSQRRRSD